MSADRLITPAFLRFMDERRKRLDGQLMARCPHCAREMNRPFIVDTKSSRDHILPRAWGGKDTMYRDAEGAYSRNLRIMCARCNSRRAAVGHCIGAMACLHAVCRDDLVDFHILLGRWHMRGMTVTDPRKTTSISSKGD